MVDMRETEKIGPPWELELTREGGRLVEIVIRATGDGELGIDAIREATSTALGRVRGWRKPAISGFVEPLNRAYQEAGGRMTPTYLAQLAVTYAEVSAHRRDVIPVLARAIGGNPETVKGHVVKARKAGYLTPTTPGKEGGEATDAARAVLSELAET